MYRVLAAATVVMALIPAEGTAQIPIDPNCPPTAWCHPDGEGMGGANGFMTGATEAADAVGRELRDYECRWWDGCLGVALRDLICAVDGREIAQVACNGPVGDTPNPPSDAPDNPDDPDDPGTPGDGSTAPDSTETQVAAGDVGIDISRFPNLRVLRDQVSRTRVGTALPFRVEGFRFILDAKYASTRRAPREWTAVIRTVPSGGSPSQVVVGVTGARLVAVPARFLKLGRR